MSNHWDIDEICDEFEEAWRAGATPQLTDFMDRLGADARHKLLEHLVPIDIEWRRFRGQTVSPEDYQHFSPQIGELAAGEFGLNDRDSKEFVEHDASRSPGQPNATMHTKAEGTDSGRVSDWIGPYQLVRRIGRGGMGEVWLANQQSPVKRKVALKLIRNGLGPGKVVARFQAERQALAMMDHSGIAKVFDAGETPDGRPFFVMELIRGKPITEFCDRKRLSIRQRIELFVKVCSAVQHAHQRGVIHRDIKPTNILVSEQDGQYLAKVIDFGLAKAVQHTNLLTDESLSTEFGQVVGTVQYMSPEQAEINHLAIDTRTDVYSLGVLLYELLTGTTPLERESLVDTPLLQVLDAIRSIEPPRPSKRLSSCSDALIQTIAENRKTEPKKVVEAVAGELDWVVMKALEKDRDRRYSTANDLATELKRYLNGIVVQARPASLVYRVRKFASRNSGLAFSAMAVALSLLVVAIGFTASSFRTNAELPRKKTTEADTTRSRMPPLPELENSGQPSYDTNINLAARAIKKGDRQVAANILSQYVPTEGDEDLRGFEWYYLNNQLSNSIVWEGGYEDLDFPANKPDPRISIVFLPHGIHVVSGGRDGTLEHHSVGKEMGENSSAFDGRTLLHNEAIRDLHCRGHYLFTVSDDRRLAKWDIRSGTLELVKNDAALDRLQSVDVSRSGRYVAVGSYDRSVRILESERLTEVARIQNPLAWAKDPRAWVMAVEFLEHEDEIVVAHIDGSIFHWNWKTKDCYWQTRNGMESGLQSMTYDENANLMAVGLDNGDILLWDLRNRRVVNRLIGHAFRVQGLHFSSDGSRLLSASLDTTCRLWDLDSGESLLVMKHPAQVQDAAFSPDESLIATASDDGRVRVWRGTPQMRVEGKQNVENTVKSREGPWIPGGEATTPAGKYIRDNFGWAGFDAWTSGMQGYRKWHVEEKCNLVALAATGRQADYWKLRREVFEVLQNSSEGSFFQQMLRAACLLPFEDQSLSDFEAIESKCEEFMVADRIGETNRSQVRIGYALLQYRRGKYAECLQILEPLPDSLPDGDPWWMWDCYTNKRLLTVLAKYDQLTPAEISDTMEYVRQQVALNRSKVFGSVHDAWVQITKTNLLIEEVEQLALH